jgi:hypothetical protein
MAWGSEFVATGAIQMQTILVRERKSSIPRDSENAYNSFLMWIVIKQG